MIHDSTIWKQELKRELEVIKLFFAETDLNYDQSFEEEEGDDDIEEQDMLSVAFIKLQKFAIYSSIIIRKLIEANKLSDEILGKNYSIQTFKKKTAESITIFNGYEIERLYDIEKPLTTNISIKQLTHLIIHSYHFMPRYNWVKIDSQISDDDHENWEVSKIEGIWFSSDKTKESEISFIKIDSFYHLIEEIIEDFIVFIEYKKGKITKKSSVIKDKN